MSVIATISVELVGDPEQPSSFNFPVKRAVRRHRYTQTRIIDGKLVTRTPEGFAEILRGSFAKMLDEAMHEALNGTSESVDPTAD